MTREVKLKLPAPQNFIVLELPTPSVTESGQEVRYVPSIPIEDLNIQEAEQYAEELKNRFMEHYLERKLQSNQQNLTR